jgi:hypothetical protein
MVRVPGEQTTTSILFNGVISAHEETVPGLIYREDATAFTPGQERFRHGISHLFLGRVPHRTSAKLGMIAFANEKRQHGFV